MKCCAKTWLKGGWILLLFLLGSALPVVNSAQAGTPISLYETHAGHVNFVGTAGSLRRGSNLGDACAVESLHRPACALLADTHEQRENQIGRADQQGAAEC